VRLLVYVVARLAITAACTNSAAAPDVRAEPAAMFFLHQQSVGVSDVEFSIGDRRRQASEQPRTGLARCATRQA